MDYHACSLTGSQKLLCIYNRHFSDISWSLVSCHQCSQLNFWSLSASLGNLTVTRTSWNFFSRIIWLSLRLHMIKKRCCTFITNGQCNTTALIFTEAFVLQQIYRSFNNPARQQSITGISTREGKHGMNASSLGNRTKPFKHSFRWLGNYQMVSPRLQFSHPIAWVLPGLSGQSAFTPRSCF